MKNNVVHELKKIAAENGGLLQPEIVVSKAKSPGSPLHDCFEWSDTKAAKEYRIWQARQLIRVSIEMIDGSSEPMNVFVSLKSDRRKDGGGYRVMTEVLSHAERRAQMLEEALEELNGFRAKYHHLKELAAVFASLRQVKTKKKAA